MSKPVKQMMVKAYRQRFGDLDGAVVVDLRGMPAKDNNSLRLGLQKKQIRVTVVKNSLAKQALAGTALESLNAALEGSCAITYGPVSAVDLARELVTWTRKVGHLALRGAVLDGHYYAGAAGVKMLSTMPTREEALGQVVQLVLSPGAQLVSCATHPGGQLLAVVDALIAKLEKGEAAATAA